MRRFVKLAGLSAAVAFRMFAQFHLPGSGAKSDSPPKPPAVPPIPAASAKPLAHVDFRVEYYVLVLAWTPGKTASFVVRGLLPQATEGLGPESCTQVKPVSKGVMSLVLPIMASASAIQQEWVKHGSCTGLSAADYFNGIRYTRSQVQIPVQLTSLEDATTESPLQIEAQFEGANPGFPAGSFRTGCEGKTFTEVRVCFDPQFKPRECKASAGECATPELSIRR